MRLLFIENEPESVKPAIRRLRRDTGRHLIRVKGFRDAEAEIGTFDPDIVVLDLLAGAPAEPDVVGLETYDFIWNKRFCPIVVYSARPDALTDTRPSHPFVKVILKGRSSAAQLQTAIEELQPHVDALQDAEKFIRQQYAFALRDVAPAAFQIFSKPAQQAQRNDAILRAVRRRLAALMDELSTHGQTLMSWEQYLCPPVCKDLNLGDVLHERAQSHTDPAFFRIIVTPSCDLANSDGRVAKVNSVLVARCRPIREGLQRTSLGTIRANKLKERLPNTILSQGYFETMMPLPELPGRIPSMVADLRDLQLIPFADIAQDGVPFERIASIDSPFRELVAWAYMQTACRPGLPDRDLGKWAQEIIAEYGS